MNLNEAMLNRLEQARDRAIQEHYNSPTGMHPMSTNDGQSILNRIRQTQPRTRPTMKATPLSSSLAQVIDSFIQTAPPPARTPLERYLSR